MQPDEVAAAVVVNMRAVLAPLQERIAVLEAKGTDAASLVALHGQLRERIAVLETRPPMPGPAGHDGAPGQDGAPGAAGTPGLRFCKAWTAGRTYELGDLVVWNWSTWHANTTTTTKPGDGSPDWSLFAGGRAPR